MSTFLLHAFCLILVFLMPGVRAGEVPTAYTVPVAPWTFPDAPERGVATEFMRHLFSSAGVPVRLDTLPYVRVINGLRDGSNAAAMLIPDAERDTFALRLCEVTTIRSGILYKKSRFGKLTLNGGTTLHGANGLTVGIQRGTHALDKLEKIPGVRIHSVRSIAQGLKMLEKDRIDAAFLSSPGRDTMVRVSGLVPDDYEWLEVAVSPVVIYVSRKAALASDKAALQRLRMACNGSARAKMEELMRKYH